MGAKFYLLAGFEAFERAEAFNIGDPKGIAGGVHEDAATGSAIKRAPAEASADATPASAKSARTANAPISHPARAPERKRIYSDRVRGGLRPAAGDVQKRVVLCIGADGDPNAFTRERPHDDVVCETCLREGEAPLPQRQPDEVGL